MASVIKRINEYNAGISDELRTLKWNALRESPFRFYRGTCHLFAQDFTRLYRGKSKTTAWICGDLHFENFGSYKGANRLVYFDLNDFDESILAGPEAELARLLTSIAIAAGQMKVAAIGLHKTLHDVMRAYVATLISGKALMMEKEVARDVADGQFEQYFERLATLDRGAFIDKHTYKHKGALLLKVNNGHNLPIDDVTKTRVYNGLKTILSKGKFEHMVFEDAAYRVAGTGSLGQERYTVLCFDKSNGKHYLMDVKSSRASCYTGLVKPRQPKFRSESERIVAVGEMMQFNSPAFADTVRIGERTYVVKEMQRTEDRMALEDFGDNFGKLSAVAREMAVLMGYAHLRSSGHMGSSTADDLKKFAQKKQWQREIIELSGLLAKRNNKYYKEFCAEVPVPQLPPVKSGRKSKKKSG